MDHTKQGVTEVNSTSVSMCDFKPGYVFDCYVSASTSAGQGPPTNNSTQLPCLGKISTGKLFYRSFPIIINGIENRILLTKLGKIPFQWQQFMKIHLIRILQI